MVPLPDQVALAHILEKKKKMEEGSDYEQAVHRRRNLDGY